MRYFTAAWHRGELADAEVDAVREVYRRRLEALAPRLPPPVRKLATALNLHDATVRQLALDPGSRTLRLGLRCGDSQTGHFDLDLRYGGVHLGRADVPRLRAMAQEAEAVLYDEVDVAPSGYVHRLLLWPYRELDIVFARLALHRRAAGGRPGP